MPGYGRCRNGSALRLGRIGCSERPGQSQKRKCENHPFRWVEVIPEGTVAVVALVGVVIVVIPLAERQERDEPAVSTGVRLTMRLASPEMADRVDAKGRIQYGKCPPNAGQHEAADTAGPPAVEKAHHEREH